MKKFIVILIAISLVVVPLAGCGGNGGNGGGGNGAAVENGAPTEQIIFRFGNVFAEDSYQSRTMTYFVELLSDRIPRLRVDTHFNSILGDELGLSESVSNGSVDMIAIGTGIGMFAPNVLASELPYLFESWEHYYAVINDPRYLEIISRGLAENNVISLGFNPIGARHLTSNRPITSMDDFSGLRFRVPNLPLFIQMGESFGASVVPMPFVELFTALESGVVDSMEMPFNMTISNRFYEVTNYIIQSAHMQTTSMWLINEASYNSLTAAEQQILRDTVREALSYGIEILVHGDASDIEYLESQGITVLTPSPAFLSDLIAATQAVRDWFAEENPDALEIFAIVEEIRDSM